MRPAMVLPISFGVFLLKINLSFIDNILSQITKLFNIYIIYYPFIPCFRLAGANPVTGLPADINDIHHKR